MSTLHLEQLAVAWSRRRHAAAADLQAAATAPALFTPEWTERADRELADANTWMSFWLYQAGA